MKVQHCGEQHHFIGKCRFHLSTFVDDKLISTVGAYVPARGGDFETIGYDRYYETMVFHTDGDWTTKQRGEVGEYAHPDVTDFADDISDDQLNVAYRTADGAVKGHAEHVEREMTR